MVKDRPLRCLGGGCEERTRRRDAAGWQPVYRKRSLLGFLCPTCQKEVGDAEAEAEGRRRDGRDWVAPGPSGP
jgi:hypothetical protein